MLMVCSNIHNLFFIYQENDESAAETEMKWSDVTLSQNTDHLCYIKPRFTIHVFLYLYSQNVMPDIYIYIYIYIMLYKSHTIISYINLVFLVEYAGIII